MLESLRRRFEWIGFRANYRARDGQLSWRGDDGSHRFAAFNLIGGGGKREKNRVRSAKLAGAAILSADSRLGALNPLLDQYVPEADNQHPGADSRSGTCR